MKTSKIFNCDIKGQKVYKKVFDKLETPCIYKPSDYKLDDNLNGTGVRMCIIDSGKPQHDDIVVKGDSACFCNSDVSVVDKWGHSTIMGGIVSGNNPHGIKGLAPEAKVSYAKVIDRKGNCDFSSLVAAILWAIVNHNNIIVLSLSSDYDFHILHNALKKAKEYNCLIFASAGNASYQKNDEIDCPARYKEVISVAQKKPDKKTNSILHNKVDFILPKKTTYSTYLQNKYVSTSGSSVSTIIVASLAALLLEKNYKHDISPQKIFSELNHLLN